MNGSNMRKVKTSPRPPPRKKIILTPTAKTLEARCMPCKKDSQLLKLFKTRICYINVFKHLKAYLSFAG